MYVRGTRVLPLPSPPRSGLFKSAEVHYGGGGEGLQFLIPGKYDKSPRGPPVVDYLPSNRSKALSNQLILPFVAP